MSQKLPAFLIVLFLITPMLTRADITGSYFAVIVNDVEVSGNWYQRTFDMTIQSRLTEANRYDIINLARPGLAIELLALADAAARPDGRIRGPFKAGFVVDDIESFIRNLPDSVTVPETIHDETNGLYLIQLRDPDENIVQVMQIIAP